jgi:hypothetical protein
VNVTYTPPCGTPGCALGHCSHCSEHITWQLEAWGDSYTCDACGHHQFNSIGD